MAILIDQDHWDLVWVSRQGHRFDPKWTIVVLFSALLLLMQSSAAADPVPLAGPRTLGVLDADRFDRCHDTATDDAVAGMVEAQRWIVEGGGFIARQCLGFAQAKAGLFDAATESFAQAATDAEAARDWRAANLWAQAGNAALAAGDPERALGHLNAALVQGRLTGLQLGEAYLDRARAALALERWSNARSDLDLAVQHAAQDPLAWLLSATLARRQGDLARAQADITVASQLGPRDAAIALEAGNIAAAGDRLDAAQRSWESAVALGGEMPAGTTARTRLQELAAFRAEEAAAAGTAVAPEAAPAPATATGAAAPPQ